MPEAYVELSNEPAAPATPQFSNDDWSNAFSNNQNAFQPGKQFFNGIKIFMKIEISSDFLWLQPKTIWHGNEWF